MSYTVLKFIKILVGIIVGLFIVGWLGFRIQPRNFDTSCIKTKSNAYQKINTDYLNGAQEQFCNAFGPSILKAKTCVVWGKAKMNVMGIRVPARFITYYIPSKGFYRYIEITWYGIPVLNGYDLYIDETAEFYIAGKIEMGDKIAQGQNLALWAESVWSPSIFITDKRLKWEETDDCINMQIPFKDRYDNLDIFFDEENGLISTMQAMRYKGQSDEKQLWQIECIKWDKINGINVPVKSSIKWEEDKKPWAYWMVEGILYNIPISENFDQEIVQHGVCR